jgi:hypothetical protein
MRTNLLARSWYVAALVAGLATSHPRDALADALCLKRSGLIVARATCRTKERPFDPAAVGLVGPIGPTGQTGDAGPPGTPGGHPYRVVDADGKTFGTMLSYDTARAQVVVTLPGVDHPVQFVVASGAFSAELSKSVYYQSPDCSGTPFVLGSTGLIPPVLVVGSMGYFTTAGANLIAIASFEFPSSSPCSTADVDTGRGTCCQKSTTEAFGAPARTVLITSLGVTPPFTVQR